jgi:hypothetical protein
MCSLFDDTNIPDDWFDDCDPFYRNYQPYDDEEFTEEDDHDRS